MAALLSDVNTDTIGTGAAMSGSCTVYVRGVFDGAEVAIQIADENAIGSYVKPDREVMRVSRFSGPGSCKINADGAYYVRACLAGAGSSTEVAVVALQ